MTTHNEVIRTQAYCIKCSSKCSIHTMQTLASTSQSNLNEEKQNKTTCLRLCLLWYSKWHIYFGTHTHTHMRIERSRDAVHCFSNKVRGSASSVLVYLFICLFVCLFLLLRRWLKLVRKPEKKTRPFHCWWFSFFFRVCFSFFFPLSKLPHEMSSIPLNPMSFVCIK